MKITGRDWFSQTNVITAAVITAFGALVAAVITGAFPVWWEHHKQQSSGAGRSTGMQAVAKDHLGASPAVAPVAVAVGQLAFVRLGADVGTTDHVFQDSGSLVRATAASEAGLDNGQEVQVERAAGDRFFIRWEKNGRKFSAWVEANKLSPIP